MKQNFEYTHMGEDLYASHSCTNTALNNEFHLHNNYEIYYFMGGNVNYFVEQACYKLQKGNLLIFNSQEIHKAVNLPDTPYERITIHFNAQIVKPFCTKDTNLLACFENRMIGTNNITLLDSSKSNFLITSAMQIINNLENKRYGSDVLPLSYLIQLLVMINETFIDTKQIMASIISPKILPILQYIETHLTDELNLDYLAKEMSLDKYYLSHLFKQNTGSTVYQYILTKRIALAKQLLLEGTSVTETCQLTGFNDYSNFIRTFKKATGVSPGNFTIR